MTISSARLSMGFRAVQTLARDLASVDGTINWDDSWAFTDGTGANQASAAFSDTRTLAASATENLDLAGVLTDTLGATVAAAKVKAIKITADAANTNNVNVTRPASNGVPWLMAAGDGISLTPGSGFMAVWPNADGVAVTAGTGDLITVTNSAGSTGVDYSIAILYTV